MMGIALLVAWMWMHGQIPANLEVRCSGVTPHVRCIEFKAGPAHLETAGVGNRSAEPQDVPAVQDHRYIRPMENEYGICLGAVVYENDQLVCVIEHYTCADKSRILLTAEDGTKHCVKF